MNHHSPDFRWLGRIVCFIGAAQRNSIAATLVSNQIVAFVVSLNLKGRHLDESQRSMVAAKIANLEHGQRADRAANLSLLGEQVAPAVTQADAAKLLNVSERTVRTAAVVRDDGAPELIEAVERGTARVSAAAEVASLPKPQQKEIVARGEEEIVRAANAIKRERKETKPTKTRH